MPQQPSDRCCGGVFRWPFLCRLQCEPLGQLSSTLWFAGLCWSSVVGAARQPWLGAAKKSGATLGIALWFQSPVVCYWSHGPVEIVSFPIKNGDFPWVYHPNLRIFASFFTRRSSRTTWAAKTLCPTGSVGGPRRWHRRPLKNSSNFINMIWISLVISMIIWIICHQYIVEISTKAGISPTKIDELRSITELRVLMWLSGFVLDIDTDTSNHMYNIV